MSRAHARRDPHVTELVNALRSARMSAGLRQADVAANLGVAAGEISEWERGIREPLASNLLRWMYSLGFTFEGPTS